MMPVGLIFRSPGTRARNQDVYFQHGKREDTEGVMEAKTEELREEKTGVGVTAGGAGEGNPVELDPVDIEILLTSGHYDDCCHS